MQEYNTLEECDAGIMRMRNIMEENKRFDANLKRRKWII